MVNYNLNSERIRVGTVDQIHSQHIGFVASLKDRIELLKNEGGNSKRSATGGNGSYDQHCMEPVRT